MVTLTRLNGSTIVVNAEMIEMIEATPDSIVTLTNGKKLVAKETVNEIVESIVQYKRQILKNLFYYREEAGS